MDRWAVNKTSMLSWPRQLKDHEAELAAWKRQVRRPKPFQPWEGYHKTCCQSFDDTGFDDEEVMKYMYGEWFDSNDTSGHGEIVVLGNQNSGVHPHVSS